MPPTVVRLTVGQLGLLTDFTTMTGGHGTVLDRGHCQGERVVLCRFGTDERIVRASLPVLVDGTTSHACITDADWTMPLSQEQLDAEQERQRAADERRAVKTLERYHKQAAKVDRHAVRLAAAKAMLDGLIVADPERVH